MFKQGFTMKLIIDDVRSARMVVGTTDAPNWKVVQGSDEALELLESGVVEEVSFDNDLGIGQMEGKKLFAKMVDLIVGGKIPRPSYIGIHTDNIIARREMQMLLRDLDRQLENA